MFHALRMRFSREQLIGKALLALEDAVQECRYRTPRRSLAVRFALAYLWTQSKGERKHFDALWSALGREKSPWSHSTADHELAWIYKAVGVDRDEEVARLLWKRWTAQEGHGGGR